jgi:hypothetical protein
MTRPHRPRPVLHRRAPHSRGGCDPRPSFAEVVCTTLAALLIVLGLLLTDGGTLRLLAADQIDDLDRELLDALEGKPPQDSPLRIIPRLLDTTQTAASRLQNGQLDDDTQRLQTQILADIDALLEQATPPAQPPQGGSQSPDQQQQQQQQDQNSQSQQQDSQSQQDGESDPNAASKESQERTARGEETDAERERRLGLSTAAWGHLPPKVREQMRSAFSEEYLPQYDALVRQYYEALARRRADER